MGGTISQAANGLGSAIGNALSAPLKSIFGGMCEEVCAGPSDVICFIEHLCIINLLKLFMICVLAYLTLLFLYLLLKLGVFQCIGRSICRCCWTACVTYWSALGHVSCLMWHKLINTKRVYRGGRRQLNNIPGTDGEHNVEDESYYSNTYLGSGKKRKINEEVRHSSGLLRGKSSQRRHRHGHCHHRPSNNMSSGIKRVSTGFRRSRSFRDHPDHRHHPDKEGDVARSMSFKRQRIERQAQVCRM